MARVRVRRDRASGIPWYYEIDNAVGRGQPNVRDDVLLIQLMLSLLQTVERNGPYRTKTKDGLDPLAVTGICEEKTIAAILDYQRSGGIVAKVALSQDGIVRPFAQSGPEQTIVRLGVDLYFLLGESRYTYINSQPGFPGELFDRLFVY